MGMRHVNFDLDLRFDSDTDRWWSEQVLLLNMMILTTRNYTYLKTHPDTPKLYDAGLVYLLPEQLETRPSAAQIEALRDFLATKMKLSAGEIQHHLDLARGVEIFRDIPRIFENGGGDCDNLACFRAAELSAAGVNARPIMTCRQDGGRTIYHALVKWPDGSSEDPSRILGMGGPERAAERWAECKKNWERYDNYWQSAKAALARETFTSEEARYARACQYKAAIDNLGLLPKSGVFTVGPRRARPEMVLGAGGALMPTARRAA